MSDTKDLSKLTARDYDEVRKNRPAYMLAMYCRQKNNAVDSWEALARFTRIDGNCKHLRRLNEASCNGFTTTAEERDADADARNDKRIEGYEARIKADCAALDLTPEFNAGGYGLATLIKIGGVELYL